MKITLQAKEALLNLISLKLRSSLALLGILVGTASVVTLVSGGQLATNETLKQVKALGTDLLSLSLYPAKNFTPGQSNQLSMEAINTLKSANPAIKTIVPYTQNYQPLIYEGHALSGVVVGTTETLQPIMKLHVSRGRFISDLDHVELYGVIGNDLYQSILKLHSESPIGKQIQVGKEYYTIIGIIQNWTMSGFMSADLNRALIVPIKSALLRQKYAEINNVVLQMRSESDIKMLENTVKSYLHTHFDQMNVYIRSPQELLDSMHKQSQILTLLLGLIGGVSLFVGGIGVMNIMLVSVIERRKEIGIRLAIGAKRRDIRTLFLIESVILTLTGGTLGVIIGVLISYIIAVWKHWTFDLFLLPPLIGFSVSVFVGIFFGFYPAYKASQLDPIECLRS